MSSQTSITTKSPEDEYLASFTEQQHHVMCIAIEKLGSSFNISKSNGFLKWKAQRQQSSPQPLVQDKQPELKPASEPTSATKKRLVIKRKTPQVSENKPSSTNLKTTIHAKLTELLTTTSKDPSIQSSMSIIIIQDSSSLPTYEGSSLYCIFDDTTMLYVGTTSDTKKNFRLAFNSTMKSRPELKTSVIYGMVLPLDDSKQRIKLRDVIKKELMTSSP